MSSYRVWYFLISLFIVDIIECVRSTSDNLDQQVGPVVFVNMLFRHGDRTPLNPYPSDPYRNLSYWPEGYGQLTNAGKLHHYQLGRWLRKRYRNLIYDGKYHHDIIKVQSTDVDRTLMSAQANLAGMFPPRKEEKWSKINWQPIPIHTIPKYLDNVLLMGAPCRKYERLYQEFKKSKEYYAILEKYRSILDYCSHYAGKLCSLGTIYEINCDLFIENQRNLSLPAWTSKIYPKFTEEVAAVQCALSTWTLEMKRLLSGPLVKTIMNNMAKKVNQTVDKQTIAVFSAHDSTIVALLNTLGVYDFVTPPFNSLVLIELRLSRDEEHYVTVLYKNTTSGEPHVLKLPGCGDKACSLTKMMDILAPVIPIDWNKECSDEEFLGDQDGRMNEIDELQEDDEVFDEEGRRLRLGFRYT